MKKWIALFTAALLFLLPLSACAQGTAEPATTDVPTIIMADSGKTPVAEKNAPLKLLEHLYDEQNMLVYSPLSLSIALGMAAEGADGETRAQLDTFLGEQRPDWMVLEDLSFQDVHLANTAFLRPDVVLLDEYKDALADNYDAEPELMEAGNVKQQVNSWVDEHTDGMIKEMLAEEPDAQTALILINALHLSSEWAKPFNGANTGFSIFHAPQGDIEVSSMRQTSTFAYGNTDGVQSISLPYRDSMLEMIVLLPEDGNLEKLINEMCVSPDEFILKYEPTDYTRVKFSLPLIFAESELLLNDALLAAGVADAFDENVADFSLMAEDADELGLHISTVLQKTALKVNETGTEAAASTAVMVATMAMPLGEPVEMSVDRPFMLLLRDAGSGYVLFAACINNPA